MSLTDSVSYLLPKMPLSCLKDFLIALSVVFVDFLSFWFLLSGLWRVLSNLMLSSTRLICNTTQFNRGPSRKSRFFPSVVRSACEDVAHNRQSQMHVCMYASPGTVLKKSFFSKTDWNNKSWQVFIQTSSSFSQAVMWKCNRERRGNITYYKINVTKIWKEKSQQSLRLASD